MAQTGFTPIQLYRTTTAAATPTAGNLADGELAINTTDERLFFKNAAGTVKVIAGAGGAGVVAGSNTQVQFNNNGVFGASANLTFNGTTLTANALTVTNATTLSGGTANGVAYLNGSKVLTTGSALTFDGTILSATSAAIGGALGITVGGALTGTTINSTGISLAGSQTLNFGGTAQRITGDFDNATAANRVAFQTSTINGNTSVAAIPNGTGTVSNLRAYNNSNPANSSFNTLSVEGNTEARFTSGIVGTGTYLPMTFYTGGSERVRIDTSGNVGIGTLTPTQKLDVNGVSRLADSIYGNGNIELGSQGTGDRVAYLDFHSSGTPGAIDNSARIIRNAGVNGSLSIEQTGTGSIDFVNGGSQRLTVTSTGNVGIGTSTTTNGNLTVQQASATTGGPILSLWNSNATAGNTCGYLRFLSNTSVRAQIHSVVDTGAPFNGNLLFSTGDGTLTERMRIDFSGNLLMGTTVARSFLTFSYGNSTGNGATLVNTSAANNTTKYNTINFVGTDTVGTGKDSGYIRSIPFDANYVASVLTFATRDADVLAERMSIGSTGIVTMNAYGVGTATFSAAGVISSVSDETWKTKDGVPVDPDAMLKKLEPGYWFYNDEKKPIFGAERQLGFYAQNVNAAIGPEAAPTPEEGKPWGYYDRSVLAVAVMSLQKALATIESLEARIATLESKP